MRKGFQTEKDKFDFIPPLKNVSIPGKSYDCEGKSFSKRMIQVDMCEKCCDYFWDFVQEKYDVSETICGVEIKIK